MSTKREMVATLTSQGVEFSKIRYMNRGQLEELLKQTPDIKQENIPVEESVVKEDKANLVSILSDLAESIKTLKQDVEILKTQKTEVITPAPADNHPISLNGVPKDLEEVAREILGEKFQFVCESMSDRPSFRFTVIVPLEYSTLKGQVEDRRSRVIDNALGVNGVRDWCLLVKQNVIKYLGQNITTKIL